MSINNDHVETMVTTTSRLTKKTGQTVALRFWVRLLDSCDVHLHSCIRTRDSSGLKEETRVTHRGSLSFTLASQRLC